MRADAQGANAAKVTAQIHEPGRRLLVRQLSALSPAQRRAVFVGAGVDARGDWGDSQAWADALSKKIGEIERARCPK